MGRSCNTHGQTYIFCSVNLKGRLGVNGRIILEWILEILGEKT
jgi:hypothetical protein